MIKFTYIYYCIILLKNANTLTKFFHNFFTFFCFNIFSKNIPRIYPSMYIINIKACVKNLSRNIIKDSLLYNNVIYFRGLKN